MKTWEDVLRRSNAEIVEWAEGRPWARRMAACLQDPQWHAQVLTVDDTGLISREKIEAQRREYHAIFGIEAGDALIEQEYYCSFEAAVLGAFWGKVMAAAEREGRIGKVDVDRAHPARQYIGSKR